MDISLDGKRVFAATGGKDFDPSLPVVVFVHGSGMDHSAWHLQMRYFAWHGRAVLAVDLPGHGRSDGPALATVPEMTDWLIRVLDAVGAARAAVAGHSMGALIAVDAAVRYPDRIRAIALVGMSADMPVNPELQAAAAARERPATEVVISWGFDRKAHVGGAELPGLWMTGAGTALLDRERDKPDALLAMDLQASNDFGDATPLGASVDCPTLFLLGARDRMTPLRAARPLIDAIDGARVVVVPDCGHMVMIEAPGATLDALKTIL